MNDWLKREADIIARLDEAEKRGFITACTHCRELFYQVSFYSPSSGCRVVRLETIDDILSKNIEYFEENLKK